MSHYNVIIIVFLPICSLGSFLTTRLIIEPCHENVVLFVLRKIILILSFSYFHTSCVRRAKALARLRGCACSPEPLLVAYVAGTISSYKLAHVRVASDRCFENKENRTKDKRNC